MSATPSASPGIETRLHDADAGVRRLALIELADDGNPDDLGPLTEALAADAAAEVRAQAATLLAGWGGAAVVDALGAALLDPEAAVREAAAEALAELKDPVDGERLLPGLERALGPLAGPTPSPQTASLTAPLAAPRTAPAAAAANGGAADAPPRPAPGTAALPDAAFAAAAALRALKALRLPGAQAPAERALGHADAAVRREAVAVLGWLKSQPALPRLAQIATDDPDAEVRRAASGALGLAPAETSPAVLPALLGALRDPVWIVREEAATTLAKLQPAAALDALLLAMQDEAWQVRLRAARALGRLHDGRALPALVTALDHEAGNLRREAAIALGELGDPQALAPLTARAADPDPEVRKAVRVALQRLEARGAGAAA